MCVCIYMYITYVYMFVIMGSKILKGSAILQCELQRNNINKELTSWIEFIAWGYLYKEEKEPKH